MVIKMNSDKSLQITRPDVIYQGENEVNNIVFYIPKNIGNISVEASNITVKFILPDNSEINRTMTIIESEYSDYVKCTALVTSDLTIYSGIVATNIQIETNNDVIAKSGSAIFLINEQREHICHCK